MDTRWLAGDLAFTIMGAEDLGGVAEMLADRRVCEHLNFGPNTREETLAYFGPMVAAIEEALACGVAPENYLFAIHERGRFVGQCAALPIAFGGDNFLIGYQLRADAWGRGIGTAAAEFALWFALDELGARKVSADCLATNLGSATILERCGFVREGVLRAHFWVRGAPRDQLLWGLLPAEGGVDRRRLRARFAPDRRRR
ncbi:MAG: GNAT family N-acetyltransferase [Nannocystaceae bacterium]